MRKLLIVFLCCGVFLMGCSAVVDTTKLDVGMPTKANNDWTVSFGSISGNGKVYASYDNGYASVEELLDVTTIIVRATPIAAEYESDVAICWVLRVAESNKEGLEEIRLRQLKDEYLLDIGQEVVLALQQDAGEGYYNIPGGGCGLFRIDKETESVSGLLLESLLEQVPSTYSSGASTELTLDKIFDMLTELS